MGAVTGGASRHSGSSKKKVVPTSTLEVKPRLPSIRSTIAFEMARPRPVPPFWRVSDESACENFWKMRWRNSSGIPGPLSLTSTRTRPACRPSSTSTVPCAGENLMALDSRLVITWSRRSLSTRAFRGCLGACRASLTWCCAANPSLSASVCCSRGSSSCGCSSNGILPDSIFSLSRMSLIRRISRSQLFLAISTRLLARSGSAPATPPETSPSEPRIEVRGVRSS